MKANEAPKKIYIHVRANKELGTTWHGKKITNSDIEYVRTDTFIKKALKWYCLDCECNDNCKDTKCFFYRAFERYLNGAENCLPPKFTYTILNEDGSTSDNWRYRHFTNKMQDAFIEKACEFLDGCIPNYIDLEHANVNTFMNVDNKKFIEDFRNYMKEE